MSENGPAGIDIDIGTTVKSIDGHPVGGVAGVVIDPDHGKISHIVVRLPEFISADKIVPVSEIRAVEDHRVTVGLRAKDVGQLPDLDEQAYLPLGGEESDAEEPGQLRALITAEPLGLPALGAEPHRIPFVVEEWRNIPEESVVLREGLPVRASGGERIGQVDEVVIDPQTEAVTHIVVRRSENPRCDKAIPVEWTGRSDEDTGILLLVDRAAVEDLPDYHCK